MRKPAGGEAAGLLGLDSALWGLLSAQEEKMVPASCLTFHTPFQEVFLLLFLTVLPETI